MNFTSEVNFDQSAFRLLYYRYKPHIFFLFIIFACFILSLTVIFPQYNEFLKEGEEAKILKEELSVSKSNLTLFSTLGDSDVDQKINIALNAMPAEKDFTGILNAISQASAKSAVLVEDFSFQVGELSTMSAKLSKQPSMQINLSLLGGVEQTRAFLEELGKTLPLSEVTKVSFERNRSRITVSFFYRPFSNLKFDKKVPVKSLSQKDLQTLSKLSSWNITSAQTSPFFQISTSSGRTNPFE